MVSFPQDHVAPTFATISKPISTPVPIASKPLPPVSPVAAGGGVNNGGGAKALMSSVTQPQHQLHQQQLQQQQGQSAGLKANSALGGNTAAAALSGNTALGAIVLQGTQMTIVNANRPAIPTQGNCTLVVKAN